jgi:pyruvate/2-oxoglutarate dehydrogenase complex dihydrolipoamide dehydrogenase (E3) component
LELLEVTMGEVLKPDLCVIGAGSGGLSVASIAASFGVPVVLVEKGEMGGDCLNVGCVPSKALIAAGDRAHAIREAGRFGVSAGEPRIDMTAVRARVRSVIAAIAPNDSVERYMAMGVKVIRAPARFVDGRTVEAGGHRIEARRFVLATGSRPAVPPIPGLAETPHLTNETVFDLDELPGHLIVIGGGPIGAELGQAFRRLGAGVTILDAGALLPREDPEAASVVERALIADGIVLKTRVTIESVSGGAGSVAVSIRQGDWVDTIRGTHVLVATGRKPVTGDLGLETAGIAVEPAGITVDKGLRTSNRRVYAIGDCAAGGTGGYRFTHAANQHAGLVIRNALFRLPVSFDGTTLPRVTYTDPEIAAVGLAEPEARDRYPGMRILRWPVAENDRAQAEGATAGHVKAMVTKRGVVVGCVIAAPNAGDLLAPWTMAVSKGMKAQDLASLVFPYPTYSEVTKRAAVEFLKPATQNAWLRRLIGVARAFG